MNRLLRLFRPLYLPLDILTEASTIATDAWYAYDLARDGVTPIPAGSSRPRRYRP